VVSLDFSVTYSFRLYHGPGVDSASRENEYHEHFQGVKAAGAWGWQPHHIHVLNVMKSGSLNLLEPSGPHQACYRIYWRTLQKGHKCYHTLPGNNIPPRTIGDEKWSEESSAGTSRKKSNGSGQTADRTDKSCGRTSNNGFNSAMPTDMDKQLLAPRMEKIYILTSTKKRWS